MIARPARLLLTLVLALPALLAGAVAPTAAQPPVTRNLTFTANANEYPPGPLSPFAAGYSACWSYVHGDGREYALIGTNNGTAIYNVTDPYAIYRVGFIPGPFSGWREMKSYRNWVYIVSEGAAAGAGLQVVRMTDPEAPSLVSTYTTGFVSAHTVSIDTARAVLICNGTRNGAGQATGMRILSIASPETPVEIAWWPGGGIPVANFFYVHDSVPIGNRLYCASIASGYERVLDFTDPAAPFEINAWTYSGAFSHNSWPDASGRYLYVTDEVEGEPLKIFDIQDVMNPVLVNAITSNPDAIVHNAHVMGDELYLSNYTEGIRILDLSDPAHPAEFASADSYPGPAGGFFGVWEVCPFFPSGTVIAGDMQTGLYVYRPARDYGIIRARVESAGVGPMGGVDVFLTTQGDSLVTAADGIVQFAPSPGTHTVVAKRFGFVEAAATRTVTVGSRDTVELSMALRPVRDYAGTVDDAVSDAPLEDAELNLLWTPLSAMTDSSGAFALDQVPEDLYRVDARAPGHAPVSYLLDLAYAQPEHHLHLVPAAFYDAFESASGWTVGGAGTGDNAVTGLWVRVEPLGTYTGTTTPALGRGEPRLGPGRRGRTGSLSAQHEGVETDGAPPGYAQPELDRTPPPGQMCWVTGQGTNPGDIGQQDVDGGKTSLTSPTFDCTGMSEPTIGYWRWFYATGHEDDFLTVLISNDGGANWVAVDTTEGVEQRWEEQAIAVADYVTPTNQVRVRFVAADLSPPSVVEAALDDFTIYDAANAYVGVPEAAPARALRFAPPRPNPAREAVSLTLDLPRAGDATVEVLDVAGRVVRTLWRGAAGAGPLALAWDGADARGRATPAGLYFVRAIAGGDRATTRIARIR